MVNRSPNAIRQFPGQSQIDGTVRNRHLAWRGSSFVFPNEKEINFVVRLKSETNIIQVQYQNGQTGAISQSNEKQWKMKIQRIGKKEYHLWKKRGFAGSGKKALHLVQIVSKWMLSKGQGATMQTYDTLLLAFDMEERVDEAEKLWNMILHTHSCSVSRLLFSRMISLYDHHELPEKIIQVFADMEELRVKPDEDTLKRIVTTFMKLGKEDKKKMVLKKYQRRLNYIHFKGERVRVRNDILDDSL